MDGFNYFHFLLLSSLIINFASACKPLEKVYKKPDYKNWNGHSDDRVTRAGFVRAIYEDCGVSKTCIVPEPDEAERCTKGGTCWMALTFGYSNSSDDRPVEDHQIAIELLGVSPSWIAVAFAPDPTSKKGAYQVECMKEAIGPRLELFESFYDDSEALVRVSGQTKAEIIESQSMGIGGLIYCKFHLERIFDISKYHINFDENSYSPIFFRGSNTAGGKPVFDKTSCTDYPEWKKGSLEFNVQAGPNNVERMHLLNHGMHMIAAFVIIIPIGTFYTRYYKAMFPVDVSLLELPIWLWVHVMSEGLALLLIYKGLQYATEARSGKWIKKPHEWTMHGQLGTLVCSLRLAFFIFFLVFRTKTVKPVRWKLRLVIHQLFGHLNYITVLYILYYTHFLRFNGLTCTALATIRFFIIFYLAMHVLLSMYFTWVHELQRFGFKIKIPNELTLFNTIFQPSSLANNQPLRAFRAGLFGLFAVVTFALGSIIISSLDNVQPVHICHPVLMGY